MPRDLYEEFARAKREFWDSIVTGLRLDQVVAWLAKKLEKK